MGITKVFTVHPVGDMNVCIKSGGNQFYSCQDISLNCVVLMVAPEEKSESTKSLGILSADHERLHKISK